jgi:hypothetical protein
MVDKRDTLFIVKYVRAFTMVIFNKNFQKGQLDLVVPKFVGPWNPYYEEVVITFFTLQNA